MEFKELAVKEFGSKGFVQGLSSNKTPEQYAQLVRNIRIINQGITVRNGYEEFYNAAGTPARGIIGNQGLFICQDSKFKGYGNIITFSASLVNLNVINLKINGVAMTPVTFDTSEVKTLGLIATQIKTQFSTLISGTAVDASAHTISIVLRDPSVPANITNIVVTLGASQPTGISTENLFVSLGSIGTDTQCNFITRGNYTIILTGVSAPYYYDGTQVAITTTLPAGVNPIIGASFAGFTVVAGNGPSNEWILYISKPISPTTPANAIDWSDTTQYLSMKSKVQGLVGSLFNLWIFTTESIEYISRNNLSNVGGVASLFSLPLGQGSQLSSPNSAIGAGDKIFYLTKDKKIRTIGFVPGIVDPQLGDLSDIPLTGINGYMDTIADDQSRSTSIFDRTRNLVKFWEKGVNSAVNDIVVIYDMINDTRLRDDNKDWTDICELNDQYYACGAFDYSIFHDETGKNDAGDNIDWEYLHTTLNYGSPAEYKMTNGERFSGTISTQTNIYVDTIADDDIVFSGVVKGTDRGGLSPLGIGSKPIGGETIGGVPGLAADKLQSFDAIIDRGYLLRRFKRIWTRLYGNDSVNPDFIIDYLSFFVGGLKATELSDHKMNSK